MEENYFAGTYGGLLPDAILDRIVHQAHRIELSGESMRKRNNIKILSFGETD